jgi:hypothetical protein
MNSFRLGAGSATMTAMLEMKEMCMGRRYPGRTGVS